MLSPKIWRKKMLSPKYLHASGAWPKCHPTVQEDVQIRLPEVLLRVNMFEAQSGPCYNE